MCSTYYAVCSKHPISILLQTHIHRDFTGSTCSSPLVYLFSIFFCQFNHIQLCLTCLACLNLFDWILQILFHNQCRKCTKTSLLDSDSHWAWWWGLKQTYQNSVLVRAAGLVLKKHSLLAFLSQLPIINLQTPVQSRKTWVTQFKDNKPFFCAFFF